MKYLIVCEGESDCWAAWHHGYAALGLPGASNVRCLRAEHVAGFDAVLVTAEPDAAGQQFPAKVAAQLREQGYDGRVIPLQMATTGHKDVSALHCADPDGFRATFDALIDAALKSKPTLEIDKSKRWTIQARAPFPLAAAFIRECGEIGGERILHHWDERWWVWDGARYVERRHREQRSILACWIRDRVDIVQPKGERVVTLEPTSWDVNNAVDALEAAVTLPMGETRPPVWLDPEKSLLEAPDANGVGSGKCVAVLNGIVALGSGELQPPSPRWFSTSALATEYDPDAECPEWLRFLDRVWTDQTSRDTLQEIMGYLLTPDMSQQKAFLIVGPPRSGKGTIGRVIQALLGSDAVTRPALADFGQSFGLEPLIGKTVAIVSDARLDANVAAGMLAERILAISGEDTINIQRKYASAWNGPLSVRFLILTNELPRFRDPSGALPKRFITLRMTKSWLGNEDPELFDRLRGELPGILNWAIEGWRRLQERGHFVQPEASKDDAQQMVDDANPLSDFLEEECERTSEGRTTKRELYKHYLKWVEDTGIKHVLAMPLFFRDLRTAWPEVRTIRGHGSVPREIVGIRVLSDWDKAAAQSEQ